MSRQKRGPESKKNAKTRKDVDCEIGVISASMDKEAILGMKPKERLQSVSYREANLLLVSKLSYRDTADTLNRLLHRDERTSVKVSTLENRMESFGKSLSEGYTARAESVLESYHVDKQTGMITSCTPLPESVRNPELPAVYGEKELRKRIMDYNRGRDSRTKLKYGEGTSCIECSDERCCYIRIDDIGVKHQKPSRDNKSGKPKKSKKYVENTVIHILAEGRQYTITAIGMCKAFKLLTAFLLENKLMEDTRLVFFSDGARNIRDNIDKFFGFRQHTLVLDWLHLRKKCLEYLSMGIKGTKAEKEEIKNALTSILWTGRHQKAVKYLDSIKDANVKSVKVLTELKDYISRKSPNLTCYALRHELGLPISSNRVEKANDIIVATRQKHNGMSWSDKGSGALAIIKTAIVNGELNNWLTKKTVRFSMAS